MPETRPIDDRGRSTRCDAAGVGADSVLERVAAWETSDRARAAAERHHAENTVALSRLLLEGGPVVVGNWSYSGHQRPGLPWFVLRRPVGDVAAAGVSTVTAAEAAGMGCSDFVVEREDDGEI